MRAVINLALLLAASSASAQPVPMPLHGPVAFDAGSQVRVLSALSGPSDQVGLGFAYGTQWVRLAVSAALDGARVQAAPGDLPRVPEQSKERYEPPAGSGQANLHLAFFLGINPSLVEFELDDTRRLGLEVLAGVGADFFFDFGDDAFPLRFGPELGLGLRLQVFDFLFTRLVVSAERDLTEFASDLADAGFILRGAIEVGAALPEPQPALDEAPQQTEVRASFALERPLEDSVSRPGTYFITVGIAY